MDWMVFIVEGLFLVLFLATFARYVRRRDPVTGRTARHCRRLIWSLL
jgi:hypothetical protein